MSGIGIATDGFLDLNFVSIIPFVPNGNRFDQVDDWVNRQRNKVSLTNVKLIEFGTLTETDTMGTIGRTVFRYNEQNGSSRRFVSRDFIINRQDYQFGGTIVDPKQRDKIVEETDFATFTYEVLAVNMEPSFRESGAYRYANRVHTKLLKKELI